MFARMSDAVHYNARPDVLMRTKYPRGWKGVDTLVQVLVSRRRYEDILHICGPDVVHTVKLPPGLKGSQPVAQEIWLDNNVTCHMKIPEASFDRVLRIDTYVRGNITLYVLDIPSQPDNVADDEVLPMYLKQNGEVFIFYGTQSVLKKLRAWKSACEEISRRVRNLSTQTGAAARPIDFQGSGRGREEHPGPSVFQERSGGEVRVQLPTDSRVPDTDNRTRKSDPPEGSVQIEYQDGRYKRDFIERRVIGQGGFGIVVEAQNKMDKGVYAVKKVFENPGEEVWMKEMVREIKLLASLSHPNIVDYKQAWVERDSPSSAKTAEGERGTDEASNSTQHKKGSQGITLVLYIQMELCGKSLYDALQSWNTEFADLYDTDIWRDGVLIILTQLLQALREIHFFGIIHRDVKPENIFFVLRKGPKPEDILHFHDNVLVKLGDFGLATAVKQQESTAGQPSQQRDSSDKQEPSFDHLSKPRGSGLTAGHGPYMYSAPEQSTKFYDNKVDIYSLGVVLAELLCLFPNEDERDQLERLCKEQIPDRLMNLSKDYNILVDTVRRMCRFNPADRPSAETLLEQGLVVTKRKLMTENQKMELMLSLLIRDKSLQLQQAKKM